jgi:mono/diheme cytochrome c family protein
MRIVLAALLAAPLLAPAPTPATASQPRATDPGEAAYQEACAACHRTPARFMRGYLDLSPADRQAALDRFLRTHYAEDDARRAAIIAWLEAHHVPR